MWNIEIQLYIQFSDRSGTVQAQVFVIQQASSTEHSGLEEIYYICKVYIHAIISNYINFNEFHALGD